MVHLNISYTENRLTPTVILTKITTTIEQKYKSIFKLLPTTPHAFANQNTYQINESIWKKPLKPTKSNLETQPRNKTILRL